MGSKEHLDSTGKHRHGHRPRSHALSVIFILGVCLGVVLAEKWYLRHQISPTSEAALAALRARKAAAASNRRWFWFGAGSDSSSNSISGGAAALAAAEGEPSFVTGAAPRNELERVLQNVAPDGEVMIVISNFHLIESQSLEIWLKAAKRIRHKNWMVVAIDKQLRDYCRKRHINVFYRPVNIPKSQADGGDNHAISAMKYEILEDFLSLGWNVLLSDVDIVTVLDPFDHLYRDSDVEGMSDGFDDPTNYGEIYGVTDESMGWSKYAQGVRHMVLNSGLFYLKANSRTMDLVRRIASRLRKQKAWDQSVFNEEIFFLSHGKYKSPQVTVRVMLREKFMNSKYLFKIARDVTTPQKPVMVHMNYHPDKTERMRAVYAHYIEGDKEALKPFPGGSEPGS